MTELESVIAKAIDKYHKDHPRLKIRDVMRACSRIISALHEGIYGDKYV